MPGTSIPKPMPVGPVVQAVSEKEGDCQDVPSAPLVGTRYFAFCPAETSVVVVNCLP